MKFVQVLLGLALFAGSAQAAVIPVAEDTAAEGNGKIARATGKAKLLTLGSNGAVLLRFDAKDFAGLIAPESVTSARVALKITKVRKAGDLRFHLVTSEWTESASGFREAPSFDLTPFATIPAASVQAQQFVLVDLTKQVKLWLTTPASDFGIAITGADKAAVDFASKEGPALGEPAWLEIESSPQAGNNQIAPGVDAAKIGNGSVDNTEFSFLDGVVSPLQAQLDAAISQALATEASEPELRMVRGTITWRNGGITIENGSGFTVTRTTQDTFLISFTQPFSATPTVTATPQWAPGQSIGIITTGLTGATASTATIFSQIEEEEGQSLHFIAVGPR